MGLSFALAFIALGIWIAAAPSSVPGLTEPDKTPSTTQMDEMGEGSGLPSGELQSREP